MKFHCLLFSVFITNMKRKIANRSKLGFVKKFLKHWVKCHLHEPCQTSKLYRFKKFITLMKDDGEYLTVEPEYDQCYNFFRELNPVKWKTEKKKKELKTLKTELNDIFNKKTENSRKHLIESDITSQFTVFDEIRGAKRQLINVRNQNITQTSENKSHFQIAQDLDIIFFDDKKMAGFIKKELKKQLFSKLHGS